MARLDPASHDAERREDAPSELTPASRRRSASDETRALYAEFDGLGEAEVKDRLIHFQFDDTHRIFAERWLNELSEERYLFAAREAAAREAERARLRRRDWLLASAI
ncbi:MAG TPA: hypothetical protein VMU37_10275, partial [Caulobacteraceae bacterium]|nr:hypothetical protein [Caulobacteraceae bacterium]